jgi:hypothetical protein
LRFSFSPRSLLIGVFVVLLTLCGCTRTQTESQNHIPDELVGYWRTDAPRYEKRFLKLERDYVTIGMDKDDVATVQRVREVRTESKSGKTIYTISSINAEGPDVLGLEFDPANGGSIEIRHMQGIVWRREAPPASLDGAPLR